MMLENSKVKQVAIRTYQDVTKPSLGVAMLSLNVTSDFVYQLFVYGRYNNLL